MKKIEEQILQFFKSHSSQSFDSDDIAKQIFSDEYHQWKKAQESVDKTTQQQAKQQHLQLIRRALYYLNKLEQESIIKIAHIEEKGKKYYQLAIDDDTIIEKGHKRIIFQKPILQTTNIEQYEHQQVMKRYMEDSWVVKSNAILIEATLVQNSNRLIQIIRIALSHVNDCVGINDFQHVIKQGGATAEFLEKINSDAKDLDVTICLHVKLKEISEELFVVFIKQFVILDLKRISLIFSMNSKDLHQYKNAEQIIDMLRNNHMKINIQNSDFWSPPYIKGRAGMYTFNPDRWEQYQKFEKGQAIILNCALSTIAIDINKFFAIHKSETEFRLAMMQAAKALLYANSLQRRKEYFREIDSINQQGSGLFYRMGRNYIRLWNYDWQKNIEQDQYLITRIKTAQEIIEKFSHTEETIFKSCGIPISFSIALSSAFKNFDPVFMGNRNYHKKSIGSIQEFYSGEFKQFIETREQLFEIFSGGDRLRIFRKPYHHPKEIIQECSFILNSTKIALFTYDFSEMQNNITLQNFM